MGREKSRPIDTMTLEEVREQVAEFRRLYPDDYNKRIHVYTKCWMVSDVDVKIISKMAERHFDDIWSWDADERQILWDTGIIIPEKSNLFATLVSVMVAPIEGHKIVEAKLYAEINL